MSHIRFQFAFSKAFIFLCFLSLGLLQGCPDPGDPKVTINEKSVVIHDIAALSGPFAFAKTMDQIVATSGGAPTSSALMLKSVVDSFGEDSFTQPLSGKTIGVGARPLESAIDPNDLLDPNSPDGMIPVGLFNRFDLAPADGSNCGEYRIVYAKKSGGGTDRMLWIFEARVPNPNPSEGIAGCAPITDFWAARSADSDVSQTVTELEKLYYQGANGVEAIVNAKNYGMPLGQLRVNLFKTPDPGTVRWALREFLVNFDETYRAIFKPEPVDDSPTAALFRAASELPSGFTAADQAEFRSSFLGQPLCNLVNPDRVDSNASEFDIVNGIAAGYAAKFNDFESISQGNEDEPAFETDAPLLDEVQTRLASLSGLTGVTPAQLMNRAGTVTCGGCHQFSSDKDPDTGKDKDLGNNATWPASLGFVQIDEAGTLSPLLTDFFVPKRIEIAQQFKENRAPFQAPATACPDVVPTSADMVTSDATRPREHDLYKDVDMIRSKMRETMQTLDASSEESEMMKGELPKLKEAIDNARKQESATPGAFAPNRRTH